MKLLSLTKSVLAACAMLAFTHGASALDLNPTQDQSVYQFLNGPAGSPMNLYAVSSGGAGHDWKSYIQFDLSSLSPSSTILSATLSLYTTSVTTAGVVNVSDATTPWTTSSVTFSTPPAGSFSTSTNVTSVNTWYNFDVTSIVQDWVSNTVSNNGLILSTNAAYLYFGSSESAFVPVLTVTATAVPEPHEYALGVGLLLAAVALVRRRRQSVA